MKKAPGSQAQREKNTGCTGAHVLLAVAAAANMACPGAQVRQDSTSQARPAPPPQDCPPGAVETMTRQLGLDMREGPGVLMPGAKFGSFERVPVKEGSASLVLEGNWHRPPFDPKEGMNVGPTALPNKTQFIGQLYIGEKLVYGRITQAVTPAGDIFPICMELWDWGGHPGVDLEFDGGVLRVYPHAQVKQVERFK